MLLRVKSINDIRPHWQRAVASVFLDKFERLLEVNGTVYLISDSAEPDARRVPAESGGI